MSFLDQYSQTLFLYLLATVVTVGAIVGVIFIFEEKNTQVKQDMTIAKQDQAIKNQGYVIDNITRNSMQNMEIIQKVNNITYEVQTEDARELIEQNFINAFISYQNRIMIKELAKELGVNALKNTPALNKTFEDFPHYLANQTHIEIIYDDNGNKTAVDIPKELQNLINPFESEVSNNVAKLYQN